MADTTKVTSAHLQRVAVVYVRQSTPGQVEHHRESTARQYALAERARELGSRCRSSMKTSASPVPW
jgi:DNA invertase Pin-like site-specific DNA recombinase